MNQYDLNSKSIFGYLKYPELDDIFKDVNINHNYIINIFKREYSTYRSASTQIKKFVNMINDNYSMIGKYLYTIILFFFLDYKIIYKFQTLDFSSIRQLKLRMFLDSISEYENKNKYENIYNFAIKTFEKNKRFSTVRKNREYRRKLFRLLMLSIRVILDLSVSTMHKRYAPEGIGYYEAYNEFNLHSNYIS